MARVQAPGAAVDASNAFKKLAIDIGASIAIPLKAVQVPLDSLNVAINRITSSVQNLGSGISGLVAKANPGAFNQFDLAVQDTLATLGQALTPVLQAITGVIRHFGDTLQTLKPVIDPIMESISRMVKIFGGLIEPVAKVLTPILDLLGQALQALEPIFESLVDGVRWAADRMVEAIKFMVESYNQFSDWLKSNSAKLGQGLDVINADINNWMVKNFGTNFGNVLTSHDQELRDREKIARNGNPQGIDIGHLLIRQLDELQKRSSVGAAVRPASFVGLEDVGKSIRAAAFSQGISSPAERTANHTAEMAATLKRIESNFAPNGSGRLRPVPQVSETDFARNAGGHLRPVPRLGDH